jgi:hypothetical protein
VRGRFHARQMGTVGEPVRIGLERQSQHVIGNAQIPVLTTGHSFRYDILNFLRHHPDKGGLAAVVDEAIIAEAVVEPP